MDIGYLAHLVHPLYKTPLQYNAATGMLADTLHPARFVIKDNVPILLTAIEEAALTETEQHAVAGSTFHYKEHYQVDAVYYDYFEEKKNPVERGEIKRLHQHIMAQIPKDAEWVLDAGCGGGWLAKEMVAAGKKVISMDITDINPAKALKNVPSPNHFGLVADVFELPVKAGSIDCIVASEIIEHVSDPKRFIDALLIALKPGGRLLITTPYNEVIQYSLCIHCNHPTPHNAHLHSFTEESIAKFLPTVIGTANYKTKVFNSKLGVRSGLQRFLGFLPLSIWQVVDDALKAITKKKAFRLMLIVDKK